MPPPLAIPGRLIGVALIKNPFQTQAANDPLRQLRQSAGKEAMTASFLPCDIKRPVFVGPFGIVAKIARAFFLALDTDNRKAERLHQEWNRFYFFMVKRNAI